MAAPPSHGDTLSMILVMGVTGSGKSYFINKLAGMDIVKTGGELNSCTAWLRLLLVYLLSLLTRL